MRDEFERQLALLNEELTTMGGLIESAIANAVKALDGDEHSINKAYDYEKSIDNKEREIESLCLKLLLTQQPVASDLRLISAALKMITDMERIGDQAEDIAEIAATAKKKMLKKSKHIQRMAAATIDMVNKSVEAFIKKDLLVTEEVSHNDDVVDALFEEIVNDLVDIFNAGIVHTAAAARFGVQGAFKHRAENGGAYFRPVEVFAGFLQQQVSDFIGERRYLDILIAEQPAIDVGKRRQFRVVIFQIGVTVLQLCVQHAEQIYQPLAQSARVKTLEVVVEHTVMPKNPGILGIQAKYQANAQLVQAFQRMFGFRVCVLLVKGII